MRKQLVTMVVFAGLMLMGAGIAGADVIQFPYVNSNPYNVSTLISVINVAEPEDVCSSPSEVVRLHYRFITKTVEQAHSDYCVELDFDRPTTPYDIVTFDFGGNVNDGLAMFNDSTSYAGGVGAPYFDMQHLGSSVARRGFILVEHRCSSSSDRPNAAHGTLDGEAMLFDVVNGAAWGYAAMMAEGSYVGTYGFADVGTDALTRGASLALLSEQNSYMPMVPIMPPSEITTKMLVTPQVIASDERMTNDMTDVSIYGQKRTRIRLLGRTNSEGMTNRNEDPISGGGAIHVRCVAGIDFSDLLGLAATAIHYEGGWTYVDLVDPIPLTGVDTNIYSNYDHAASVIKLEYGAPLWANGSMINAAREITTYRTVQPNIR